MPLHYTPLDAGQLSPAAQKVLGGPGPMKMMAARGLAPLPRPADLVTVLYQLAQDADAKVKEAAAKSAIELPDKVLGGALQDGSLDPRVLDFFARKVKGRDEMISMIILNQATADETIADLASVLGEREIELISANETRLLRHPEIVGAMYMNRHARMSTVDRAVELAVRNKVRVPGIPAWDEVVAAVLGTKEQRTSEEVDALFAQAAKKAIEEAIEEEMGGPVDEDRAAAEAEDIPISQMSIPMKIRLAALGNKFTRSELVRDANKMVAVAAIKAPGVTELEAVSYAGNSALKDEVIAYIATRRDWVKLYSCKLALVGNPKTPMAVAMRLLPHLRGKDLRNVARSKNIPSAVATQARKLSTTRGKGDK